MLTQNDMYILFSLIAVLLVYVVVIVIMLIKRDSSGFNRRGVYKNGTRYDNRGYDRFGYDKNGYDFTGFDMQGLDRQGFGRNGYNRMGYNRKREYNRLFDYATFDKSFVSRDGFYDPRYHSVGVTTHARKRFAERMGITDNLKMDSLAIDAYCYGKSKRQLRGYEVEYIKRKEKDHEGSTILLYGNFYYVFSADNSLITLYKKEKTAYYC